MNRHWFTQQNDHNDRKDSKDWKDTAERVTLRVLVVFWVSL